MKAHADYKAEDISEYERTKRVGNHLADEAAKHAVTLHAAASPEYYADLKQKVRTVKKVHRLIAELLPCWPPWKLKYVAYNKTYKVRMEDKHALYKAGYLWHVDFHHLLINPPYLHLHQHQGMTFKEKWGMMEGSGRLVSRTTSRRTPMRTWGWTTFPGQGRRWILRRRQATAPQDSSQPMEGCSRTRSSTATLASRRLGQHHRMPGHGASLARAGCARGAAKFADYLCHPASPDAPAVTRSESPHSERGGTSRWCSTAPTAR